MVGPAWDNLCAWARKDCPVPNLGDQDDSTNVCVLAKALVGARTHDRAYSRQVAAALRMITDGGAYRGRALALGRELAAYAIAADLIDLRSMDPALDARFRAKLRELRVTPTTEGPANLVECHELRPNNWGTHCGASRIAIAAYLGDHEDLGRAANILRGFPAIGPHTRGSSSRPGQSRWRSPGRTSTSMEWCPSTQPAPRRSGDGQHYNVDGALIDDMSRGCPTFRCPPCHTQYPWESLGGAIVQAEILYRLGYATYDWENQALRRVYEYPLDSAHRDRRLLVR